MKFDMKHYKEKISAYLHHELPENERREITEHLSLCAVCRAEYDEINFGAELANNLTRSDAPLNIWHTIENRLDEKQKSPAFFDSRFPIPAFPAIVLVIGVSLIFYFAFLRNDTNEIAVNQTQNQSENLSNEWSIETISGEPKTDNRILGNRDVLTVGETLETDENSRAKVQVADIGEIELAPNSRIQLVKTDSTEHRLSLEKGVLQATILAPPRLFVVDTPSAVAVDLGCAYALEVDENGNSKLHVTSGFVALERDGRESIVPAGAMAITKKGKGLGTPFAEDASDEFQDALYKFDFENGGEKSLQIVLKNPNVKTSVTLWHLLSRVPENEREKVFDKLVSVVKLPDGVTKDGILKLDADMLKVWRLIIEGKWFEEFYK